MKLRTIPSDFIRRHASLSWDEAQWGVEQHLADKRLMVDLACDRLCCGSDNELEIRLAGLLDDEDWMIDDLVGRLIDSRGRGAESVKRRKWLFLLLLWIFENRENISESLQEVEMVYAEFGYPSEISSFVRYMRVTDGYGSRTHSLADNEKRLLDLWREYLIRTGAEFSRQKVDGS